MKVVALAGGVGGAKLADGLARALPAGDLTVIVNTADDFEHLGLHISPDLDTVCYTLSGQANPETGWGMNDETWNALGALGQIGGPTWFRIGDRDLATHVERTRRLREGQSLSSIVRDFCQAWGVAPKVLPMTDDTVQTVVQTTEGDLAFQEYFVLRHFEPVVKGFLISGAESAQPAPGVTEALRSADGVVICPSNPWVSIGPILAIPGIRSVMDPRKTAAVSPIIGGRAIRGPAAKMYAEMSIAPSAAAVAKQYEGVISGFVMDREDVGLKDAVNKLGMKVLITNTLMISPDDRLRLARSVLDFIGSRDL